MMGKSVLNQRYCYKINSDMIRRNKGNVKITNIRQGIKNRFIVGIGDSTGTRMIRSITNSIYTEEYIDDLKKQIKELKKDNNKSEISKLNKEVLFASLQSEICNVVFKSDKDYERYATKGFKLNGKKYSLLLGTAGGIKMNTVMFISDEIKDEIEKRINNGADFTIPMMPSKLMAYKSLTFSSSIPVTYTPNILVVEDIETSFTDKVIHIKFDDDKIAPTVQEIENYTVVNNACDGCGLIRPEIASKWGLDLNLDYSPTSFVVRNSWIKGVLTSFDFEDYANSRIDMRDKKVTDVWGKEWNLKDVDIIMNRSMFKLSKHYKSMDEFLNLCNENGYEFSVTKYVHKEIDNERMVNYQYIQCLNLDDKNIDDLLKNDITEIKEIIGDNYIKSILFGKGKDLNDKNVWRDDLESRHINALMINKECINDTYVRDRIKRAISKRVDMLKTGKISVKGNYQIAIGEPVIQLESAFGIEPKGLLNSGEFYIEYWRSKGIDKVAGFRSPMSCKQNARIMNVCNKEEIVKWYGGLENIIIFNAWDTSMSAFNGEDFDGDLNFTTSNKILINGIYDLPTIFCDGKNADKISNPTKEHFIKAIKDGFGNKVGSVTNFGSSCYDKISLFKEGTDEYNEIENRIMSIQYLQQECIDSAKNGIPPKPIPSHWLNYKSCEIKVDKETGEVLDSEEEIKVKLFNQRVLTEKKPYYFRYIYKETNNEYLNYIKSMEINSLRNFRKTIEELKGTINKTNDEIEFLDFYDRKMPLSNNPCIVNKIAYKVENAFEGDFKFSNKKPLFNYEMYKSETELTATNKEIGDLVELYKEYKKIIKSKTQSIIDVNKEDNLSDNTEIFAELVLAAKEIITNDDLLLNTMIDLAYKKSKISKTFAWCIVGDKIIKNLLIKNNNKITYPIRDEKGEVLFNGQRFKMIEKIIKGEN